MPELNISTGDKIRMNSFGKTVNEFIVLETEIAEGTLNAFLYNINEDNEKYKVLWWKIWENHHIEWEVEKTYRFIQHRKIKEIKQWESITLPKETK